MYTYIHPHIYTLSIKQTKKNYADRSEIIHINLYGLYGRVVKEYLKMLMFCHHKNHKNERNPLISICSK